jgi:hypothetical protein
VPAVYQHENVANWRVLIFVNHPSSNATTLVFCLSSADRKGN